MSKELTNGNIKEMLINVFNTRNVENIIETFRWVMENPSRIMQFNDELREGKYDMIDRISFKGFSYEDLKTLKAYIRNDASKTLEIINYKGDVCAFFVDRLFKDVIYETVIETSKILLQVN